MVDRQASAFWLTFDRAAPSVRQEWLLSVISAGFERPPGISAVVGRGRLNDLRAVWFKLSPDDQRKWFAEFLTAVPDFCDIAATILSGASNRRTARDADCPVAMFMADCTKPAFGVRTPSAELHRHYLTWAHANGAHSLTARMLAFRLKALGCRSIKSSSTQWLDIEIIGRASAIASALAVAGGRSADSSSSHPPNSGSLIA